MKNNYRLHSNLQDKGWRKNRRPNPTHPNCVGVDLNRNFDSHHGGTEKLNEVFMSRLNRIRLT